MRQSATCYLAVTANGATIYNETFVPTAGPVPVVTQPFNMPNGTVLNTTVSCTDGFEVQMPAYRAVLAPPGTELPVTVTLPGQTVYQPTTVSAVVTSPVLSTVTQVVASGSSTLTTTLVITSYITTTTYVTGMPPPPTSGGMGTGGMTSGSVPAGSSCPARVTRTG